MGSIENISELCRLCLVKDQVNVPIFEENATKEQTFVKINSCLPVKVSRDDSLPKKICDGCSCKLDMLYTFRNTSVDSEKQLLKWLNQAGLSCSQSAVKDPLASTKPEVTIKQETFEPTDSRDDLGLDTHSYIMQQQKLPYSQEFEFGEPSESNVGLMTDEPAPKKAKRAAALNKASVETDEDDLDAAMQITKAEDEDSDEIDQPEYVEAPSTSADDQPGPSGVNKTTVEAPSQNDRSSKVRCKLCNVKFENSKMIKWHRRKFHTPDRYQCTTCGKTFKERYLLKLHSVVHSPEKTYHCKVCGIYVKTYHQLIYHNRKHRTIDPKTCPHCNRQFRSASSYKEHLDTHKGLQFPCTICQKTYKSILILNRHMKTHIDVAQSRCEFCQKFFKTPNSLRKHVKKLHQGERHLCDICGKSLTSAASLRDHTLIHTGEKPFPCPYCEKRFAKKQHLTDHVRVHTKEKPHACPYCEKKYSQRTPLTLHIRSVHEGEKPFACVICSKRFVSNALLQTHLRLHTNKNVK
ncbi:gastrula zinc finger protein XlCGF57.1 isoform X27 [Tribolium castaneum]|uniref:gastrula zinc finger protein XlCGF57.1 isoform X27 n=1 Tax=Tribolium castaneum TaxID=7070 RepID=UPI00017580B3|nr:PREDICTED: gastrula zinc finger protein XlCGF57.1 isoform X30 [Tribolium castaneum]|eukprot:XP_015834146.1 PREDICTED: gastrula zinc finger protein XlCGF57.1 isoform X30 [Tribolium castaneum]